MKNILHTVFRINKTIFLHFSNNKGDILQFKSRKTKYFTI